MVLPGPAAQQFERENRSHSLVAVLPEPDDATPVGSTTNTLTGVMGHNGRGQQLLLEDTPELTIPAQAALAPPLANGVRIVNSNLLNFFNGDGNGGGFPTEPGR